jgi:hypothetical protein
VHIPTHILSGWVVANALPLGPRERLFCMVAATIPDVDGLGYVAGPHFYERYHHVLGHNFTFALLVTAVLTALSTGPRGPGWRRAVAGIAYFALFHLHLLMDYYGSGPGWGISYGWPWRHGPGYWWICPHGWAFFSWQNLLAFWLLLAWTVGTAVVCRRTPLEVIAPRLDAGLLRLGRRPAPSSSSAAQPDAVAG